MALGLLSLVFNVLLFKHIVWLLFFFFTWNVSLTVCALNYNKKKYQQLFLPPILAYHSPIIALRKDGILAFFKRNIVSYGIWTWRVLSTSMTVAITHLELQTSFGYLQNVCLKFYILIYIYSHPQTDLFRSIRTHQCG